MASQTVFTVPTYTPGINSLRVFINGVLLNLTADYVETNSTTVTLTTGATAGDVLTFITPISVWVSTTSVPASIVTLTPSTYNSGASVQTALTNVGSATGATNVGYTASGAGAVPRTVASKLGESVSVLDFGADPTGGTDSTTAVQEALTAGAAGEVIFPAGTYKISTGPVTVSAGTTVRFLGSSKLLHYGTGKCLAIQGQKDVVLDRVYIDLTNAGGSAAGIAIQGGWYISMHNPRVVGGNSGQTGIWIETSPSAGANYGAYMIEIHAPDLNNNGGAGSLGYGIQTLQTTSDTYNVTMLNIYGGWGKNCTYGLYIRNCVGFHVYGWTHDTGTDCINIASSSDGVLMPGELGPASGYGINWGSGNAGMYLIAPNSAGTTPSLGYQNTATYSPCSWIQGAVRAYGSRSDPTYWAEWKSNYSYAQAFTETIAAGGSGTIYRQVAGGVGQQLLGTNGISGTATASKNLRGYATFAASTSVAVTFTNAEPDANYYVSLSGVAQGYCWVTSKATTGFTINCSASNSSSVDWHLIR
jgi:hypothetical protein